MAEAQIAAGHGLGELEGAVGIQAEAGRIEGVRHIQRKGMAQDFRGPSCGISNGQLVEVGQDGPILPQDRQKEGPVVLLKQQVAQLLGLAAPCPAVAFPEPGQGVVL